MLRKPTVLRNSTVLIMLVLDLQNELHKRRNLELLQKVQCLRGDIACEYAEKAKTIELLCNNPQIIDAMLECKIENRKNGYNFIVKWHTTSSPYIGQAILITRFRYGGDGKLLCDTERHIEMLMIPMGDSMYQLNCWEWKP